MVFTENDLQERLAILREQGRKSLAAVELEFEEHLSWIESVRDGVKNGTISVQAVLVPKTPGKQRQAPLNAITESLETSIELEHVRSTRSSTQNKRVSRKAQAKKAATKIKQAPVVEEDDDDIQVIIPPKAQKRLSEETIDVEAKRLCGRSSEATSRDSGLSSVGSHMTRGSTLSGAVVKHEVLTPKQTSLQSTVTADYEEDNSLDDSDSHSGAFADATTKSPPTQTQAACQTKKRSLSADRETFVKQEISTSLRSSSLPRESTDSPFSSDKTLVIDTGSNATFTKVVEKGSNATLTAVTASPATPATPATPCQPKSKAKALQSPIIKAPPAHLLKGESVKKAVKAFEALNEDHEAESEVMAPPALPPASKPHPPAKTDSSSLDDAVNAPTRVTRTKTRAMAKAAADVETQKPDRSQSEVVTTSFVSKTLKSPTNYQQKTVISKTVEKKVNEHHFERENSTLTSSKILMKPFGSASKQQPLFLKAATPLNRMTPLTPSHSASISFSATRNLVTSVDSFILKPAVNQEVKPSREENLQKLAAKTEGASKKKEEMMKAQMEERIKKRQEKRLKVCATREAMEKEKQELQLRLEREREEKQKQIQAEREEKLRQEYLKKKRLAQQKAAETEERRRQEEAARLAKIKQQEEEQRRIAAQRKKEQEEAERKQMERMQQEREAAAHRAKEADRLAQEAALKAKQVSKTQLDQTYDKLPPTSESYGMTPTRDEREPIPPSNPDNYGIDDAGTDDSSEDESKPKKLVPLWAQPKQRIIKLMDDYEVSHKHMFSFFGSKKCTPDLSKIFTAIDRRQLIRKSSAVWRTPPSKC